eukprot:CAMPEP_0194763756 /NCGR_PEP_ID=MMETSP0323_2-20130528/20473_1 /TAXON_ID=2866 ORGANISM="Crypthecodinium cohnii, Strain Seligo" /NCGR_SAMPLE_ID=MMETSP0323_2 /ASSEMBLY_ACC=CAM_ASM_000346 /LENGTH=77 /DNA_ID=CAMNT_0039689365 /DNA_START=55 /DNA_END=285 /DNA_ORIENTATION=+
MRYWGVNKEQHIGAYGREDQFGKVQQQKHQQQKQQQQRLRGSLALQCAPGSCDLKQGRKQLQATLGRTRTDPADRFD